MSRQRDFHRQDKHRVAIGIYLDSDSEAEGGITVKVPCSANMHQREDAFLAVVAAPSHVHLAGMQKPMQHVIAVNHHSTMTARYKPCWRQALLAYARVCVCAGHNQPAQLRAKFVEGQSHNVVVAAVDARYERCGRTWNKKICDKKRARAHTHTHTHKKRCDHSLL
jgi:hypothetical protein